MSLAPDKKIELTAAKAVPALADNACSVHHDLIQLKGWTSLLLCSGPVLRVLYEEDGQDLVEYAFIMALVGLGALAAISGLAGKLKNALNVVGSNLISAT